MRFLTSGCSFTGQEKYNSGWPVWLKEFGEVKNLGAPGAGNQYISDSVVTEIAQSHTTYDCVLVMWSGLQRMDFLIDQPYANKDLNVFEEIDYEMHGDKILGHKDFKKIVAKGNEFTRGLRSILEIIKLQNFLENKNLKYYFMSYVNYWNDQDYIKNHNFGIFKYKKLKDLCKQINFANFIFAENNDCIYETSLKCNGLDDDQFHPSTKGHDYWMCNYVYPRLVLDQVIKMDENV